jgi:hypothetical protein
MAGSTMMQKVATDIKQAADKCGGKIDVLAVTHEHWDHVSGFSQARETFKSIGFGETWLAWTEDPTDPLAKKLKGENAKAFALLEACAAVRAIAGQSSGALDLMTIAGMNGAAGEKTRAAMDFARNRADGKPPIYHVPGGPPIEIENTGARIYVLGPPHDEAAIRNINPSRKNPQTYELALDGSGVLAAGVAQALSPSATDDIRPFSSSASIPLSSAKRLSSCYIKALRSPEVGSRFGAYSQSGLCRSSSGGKDTGNRSQ